VRWFAADVTKKEDVAGLKTWIAKEAPVLDILISAVGGSQRALFEELDDDAWYANYEFNVMGAVRTIRAALEPLKHSKTGGRIRHSRCSRSAHAVSAPAGFERA